MTDEELDYRSVRRRVVRRLFARGLFYANCALFLLHVLTNHNSAMGGGFSLLWLMFLIGHFLLAFNIIGRLLDSATRREIERLRRQGFTVADPGVGSKLKRDQVARLVDDGEIVFEDEALHERRKRQSRS